jgi:hypothetical protein
MAGAFQEMNCLILVRIFAYLKIILSFGSSLIKTHQKQMKPPFWDGFIRSNLLV